MRTVHFRSLSLAAAAALTFTGSVAAQDKPSALLNNLEVRQLVARAEAGDQAQLSAHFNALADRYAAEAKRHISMSQSFVGNPSRNLGTGMSAHCNNLRISTRSPQRRPANSLRITQSWPAALRRLRRKTQLDSRPAPARRNRQRKS